MNPLFQPAQVVRPQSAQLQHTLSSMQRQLSALENSMQQPPGIEADGNTPAGSTADDSDAAQWEAGPVDIPDLSKVSRDELRRSRRSKDAVWQRPVTAGQVRSPISLQEQHHAAQQSRPQTAFPARQEWPVSRLGLELQGHMPWMQEGSLERPSSPVRDRMKHAVERESCLRLEAEMAALDVGELLHQKAAAEDAAQAEAARNGELQQQMAQDHPLFSGKTKLRNA
ncbi:hypothetical protein WJX82_009039 [Trebouxia sp. C0006]